MSTAPEQPGTPDEIAAATKTANDLAQAFINSAHLTYAQRAALTDDYRAALTRLRELNGGHAITLSALGDA
ncbi:hypothetical protein [Streptacidiphilus sp. PAMC 29251]